MESLHFHQNLDGLGIKSLLHCIVGVSGFGTPSSGFGHHSASLRGV